MLAIMLNATESQQGFDSPVISLAQACVGKPLHVRSLDASPSVCQRLQELGFCEDAEIIKISQGTALICQVCGVRMALSKGLAKQILVQPCS